MSKNNGLLDLSILENAGKDEVLDLPINEEADVSVPVPGGLKESAPGQPADQTIPVPAKKDITADAYNTALANLKKSFKEAVEVMEMLENVVVVEKTTEQRQDEFTENAIVEAYITSLEDGPMFEKVDKANKNEVKALVRKLRPKIAKEFRVEKNVDFRDYHWVIRLLTNGYRTFAHATNVANLPANAELIAQMAGTAAAKGGLVSGAIGGAIDIGRDAQIMVNTIGNMIKNHTWQFLGVACTDKNGIDDFVKELNEKFKDELGDYRIIYTTTTKTIVNCFMAMTKGGFKFSNRMFLLIIDDKEPEDMKSAVKQADKELKAAHKSDKKGDKSVNESTEPDDEDDDDEDENEDKKDE